MADDTLATMAIMVRIIIIIIILMQTCVGCRSHSKQKKEREKGFVMTLLVVRSPAAHHTRTNTHKSSSDGI